MEKPKLAGSAPEMVELEVGKNYAWCACGKSLQKTFCDGSHQGSSFTPVIFQVDKKSNAAICLCKKTSNPPY